MIEFFVPGIPKSNQRGKLIRLPDGRKFNALRNTEWGNVVALAAIQAKPPRPLAGPLVVELAFTFLRPSSVSPRKRPAPDVKPDIDNLLKRQLDALNGILWEDDAQIVRLVVSKDYTLLPGLRVTVTPWLPRAAQESLTLAVAARE